MINRNPPTNLFFLTSLPFPKHWQFAITTTLEYLQFICLIYSCLFIIFYYVFNMVL